MVDLDNPHFSKIFWFCVFTEFAGLIFLAALIWIPVPQENQSMANIAIGFDTATVIGIPLSFLLGGNFLPGKKQSNQPNDIQKMEVAAEEVNVNDKS